MTFIPLLGYTFVDFMPSGDLHMTSQVLDRLCVAGINYQKADTHIRGVYAVSREEYTLLAAKARQQGMRSVFVVSTCNRTEIYGFAEQVMLLANLLVEHTSGSIVEFLEYAYLKQGEEALDHLLQVAAGLDSQILGDFEILGQLRQSVEHASKAAMIGPLMNRTVSFALQASKRIKAETALSTGTVSVSYAAIELLRTHPGIQQKNILVIGAGKFGGNVCRNLVAYLPGTHVSVINRTDEHAITLALHAGIHHYLYKDLHQAIDTADVIIVCTNADEPTVLPHYFSGNKNKLILDLSVPVNVHTAVKTMPNIRVIDVDEISTSILDKTFARRMADLPKAKQILADVKAEYLSWLFDYRYALHLKTWKDKLQELDEWQPATRIESRPADGRKLQLAVTRLAVNLRTNQEKGCLFINSINDYLQMS